MPTPRAVLDMPSTLWFISSIQQLLTATGYRIIIHTDIACHLWMRWTLVQPKEHLIPVIRRGVAFRSDKYFCFDVYEDNEQEEAGDTLQHTFIKEPWPVCETRYFYFHGEISGTPSPSTSCIFSKHRTLEDYGPPVWLTSYLQGDCVWFAAVDTDWDVVQTKWPGSIISNPLSNIDTYTVSPNYIIRRGAMQWDTSCIPAGSLIVEAYFRVYGRFDPVGDPPSIDHWQDWLDFPAWDGTNNGAWYAIANALTLSCCEVYVLASWGNDWREHPLNANGLSKIIPAGITKYLCTTRHDVLNINPGVGRRGYQWRRPAGFDPPTLHVRYKPLL